VQPPTPAKCARRSLPSACFDPAGFTPSTELTIIRAVDTKKIGMLGAGNMAGALIRGLLASGTVKPEQVRASDVRADRLEELKKSYGIETTGDNRALAAWANLLVLSVKPQVIDRVLDDIGQLVTPETVVVSIAAGVPIRALEARFKSGVRVVRAMPNTAAIVLEGATGIAPGAHATAEDVATAKTLFDAVGRTVVLDESLIDAVTGLSGSGPAYIMLMIEALADGGVKVGLHRDTALLLAAQTVYGSAKLQLETGEHPGRLKDMVTSPGGTAIVGLHTLEAGGLRRTLIDAVEDATARATELGEQMAKKLERS
jgi:pyrroline-5-carboxylate reductase